LDLAEMECSESYLEEARQKHHMKILTEPRDLPLDRHGNLPTVADWR